MTDEEWYQECKFNIERELSKDARPIYEGCLRKYGDFIGSGESRVVFDTKRGYVIKIPFNYEGEIDNRSEYISWQSDCRETLAKCRWI